MADTEDQKHTKKVNFSEATRPHNFTNKNRSGASRNQSDGGPYKPAEDTYSQMRKDHYNKPKGQSHDNYYNKGYNEGNSRGNINRPSHDLEGSFHNRNTNPRNKNHSESESRIRSHPNNFPDFNNQYHGNKRDNKGYEQGNPRINTQSKEYESIGNHRGNERGNQNDRGRLHRSRSFGQSGVGKAMENFGVRDLREILDRKHQNKEEKISSSDVDSKKKIPPNDPDYNFLKDPLRENPKNIDNDAQPLEKHNDKEGNKKQSNQKIYQPNKNKRYENLPEMTVKNHENKNENRPEHFLKNKPKHESTTTEIMKDLPNIKIQFSVDNNLRTTELDDSIKIPELKHFPDEVKRGRGRGRDRGSYRGRGARNIAKGQEGAFDNNDENSTKNDKNVESKHTKDLENEDGISHGTKTRGKERKRGRGGYRGRGAERGAYRNFKNREKGVETPEQNNETESENFESEYSEELENGEKVANEDLENNEDVPENKKKDDQTEDTAEEDQNLDEATSKLEHLNVTDTKTEVEISES